MRMTFLNCSSSSSSRAGRLIERIEREAAEPAGLQRLDQRRAVDHVRPRHVDDEGAGLHARELRACRSVSGRGTFRQLRDQPVGLGEERIERGVGDAARAFLGLRQAAPLEIEHAHAEGDGAGGDLAADLAKTDQPERGAVENTDAADARPQFELGVCRRSNGL